MLRFKWLLLPLIVATAASSQQRAGDPNAMQMPGMNHAASSNVINGSQNPELIPDAVAYRLFFIAIGETQNPPPERQSRQNSFIRRIGLIDSDRLALISALADFKVEFGAMVTQFNASETAAQQLGTPSGADAFLVQRDGLVQRTRDRLETLLTVDGLSRLDIYVKGEKSRMSIAGGQ